MNDATFLARFCLGVVKHERYVTTATFRRNALFPLPLLIQSTVQPRSTTTCGKFNGVATIHAVFDFIQNHPASGVQESTTGRPIV